MSITQNIDRTTNISEDWQKPILPAPPSVKIELTNKCNLRCSFCSHGSVKTENMEMPWDLYTKIIDQLAASGVKEVAQFYVGEPLMCSYLAEAIKYAKDAGIEYDFLTTNGTLATPEKIEPLMAAGLDSLKFSFNSSNPDQFRKITSSSPRLFDKVIQNIKSAHAIREAKGYKTRLYASSIKYDGNQQKEMEAAVAEIMPYIDEHYWLPLYSFGAQATEKEKEFGWRPGAGNQGRLGQLRDPLPCWAIAKEGHITVDGILTACCFESSDKWAMADLKEVNFMEGWNSEKFQELRKAHFNLDVHGTACEECIYGTQT